MEGLARHDSIDISLPGCDRHGKASFEMALDKVLGLELCPRSKALRNRQLFLPCGTAIRKVMQEIFSASGDICSVETRWI